MKRTFQQLTAKEETNTDFATEWKQLMAAKYLHAVELKADINLLFLTKSYIKDNS